jgi:hypothetical protein
VVAFSDGISISKVLGITRCALRDSQAFNQAMKFQVLGRRFTPNFMQAAAPRDFYGLL